MSPINTILISCSMLLTFASNIQMQHFKDDSFQPEKHLTLPPYSHVVIGQGIQENHLPIGIYTHRFDKSKPLGSTKFYRMIYENCYVYTRTGEYCRVDIGDGDPSAGVIKKISQLNDNKVVLIVTSVRNTVNPITRKLDIHDVLVTIDMNTCVTTSIRHLPHLIWPHVVIHEDRFDVIYDNIIATYDADGNEIHEPQTFAFGPDEDRFDVISDNIIATYDADGNEIHEPQTFAFAPDYSLLVVRPALGSFDRFVVLKVNYMGGSTIMSLIDRNGTEVKRIIEFDGKDDFKIERDDGTLNFCRSNFSEDGRTTNVECMQYDEVGNEKSRHEMILNGVQEFVDLKSTRDGNLVFFMKDNTSNLYVTLDASIEGYRHECRTLRYALPDHEQMRITNFDERSGTFELAYENSTSHVHGYNVMLQKYKMPSLREDPKVVIVS